MTCRPNWTRLESQRVRAAQALYDSQCTDDDDYEPEDEEQDNDNN